LSRLQALLKKFNELERGERNVIDKKEQVGTEKRLALAKDKLSRIKNIVAGLRLRHEDYDEVFNRVKILIDD